jgi:hypothetical protein
VMSSVCTECDSTFTSDQSSGDVCFRCKVRGLSWHFKGGGGYGRDAFRESTNREVAAKIVADAKANGHEVQPVGKRWV